jgi:hypothetical protein
MTAGLSKTDNIILRSRCHCHFFVERQLLPRGAALHLVKLPMALFWRNNESFMGYTADSR